VAGYKNVKIREIFSGTKPSAYSIEPLGTESLRSLIIARLLSKFPTFIGTPRFADRLTRDDSLTGSKERGSLTGSQERVH
jgi:hypothetical protein